MKFNSTEDIIQFLMESGMVSQVKEATSNPDWIPSVETINEFIKKRSELRRGYRDYAKSSSTANAWKKNRWKYMKGIHNFHRSVAGKKFHRNLGTFLATRILRSDESYVDPEYLVAASSLKTHLYLELLSFSPIHKEVEFFEFLEVVLPVVTDLETILLEAYRDGVPIKDMEVPEDVEDMLFSVITSSSISEALSEALGKKVEDLQATWTKAEELASSKMKGGDWREVVKEFQSILKES
jgi:hypothetical protein